MPILMPLKKKYRRPGRLLHRQFDPKEGTRVYSTERHASKQNGNSGQGVKPKTVRPRRRAYAFPVLTGVEFVRG